MSSKIEEMTEEEIIRQSVLTGSMIVTKLQNPSRELCEKIVRARPGNIAYIPTRYKDSPMFRIACATDATLIRFHPNPTGEDLENAISQSPAVLDTIRANFPQKLTPGLCAKAVALDPTVLASVPKELITDQVAEAALDKDPMSLNLLLNHPEGELVNPQWIAYAAARDVSALRYLSNHGMNLLQPALDANPMALKYVKLNSRTEERCWSCVRRNAMALQYVPEKRRTPAMIEYAASRDIRVVQFIRHPTETQVLSALDKEPKIADKLSSEILENPRVAKKVVAYNGLMIGRIRPSKQSLALCLLAVNQNGHALKYIGYQLPAVCITAIRQNADALHYCRHRLPVYVEEALVAHPNRFEDIYSGSAKNKLALLYAAYLRRPDIFKWVPNNAAYSREQTLHAVCKNPFAIRRIEQPDPVLYMAAVRGDPRTIQYVPAQYITPEMSRIVLQSDPSLASYLPEKCSPAVQSTVHGQAEIISDNMRLR